MLVPSANGEYTIEYTIAHPALVTSNADGHDKTTIIDNI